MPASLDAVDPQPRIDLRSTDAETGAPVRVTTYRGVVSLSYEYAKGDALGVPQTNPFTFFLPDSLPYPAGTEVTVAAMGMLTLQSTKSGSNAHSGPYGLADLSARLVDDPQGSGWRYVQVDVVNTWTRPNSRFTYEVTVVTPVGD